MYRSFIEGASSPVVQHTPVAERSWKTEEQKVEISLMFLISFGATSYIFRLLETEAIMGLWCLRRTLTYVQHVDCTVDRIFITPQLLENALRKYPSNTPERWDKIAEEVPGRTKKECMKRYKVRCELQF